LKQLFSAILRAIQFVLIEGKTLHESHTASLLSAMKKLIFYGAKHHPFPNISIQNANLYSNNDSNKCNLEIGSDNAKIVVDLTKENESRMLSSTYSSELSSDSEKSDTDSQQDR
jgi:hypothetical protein